MNVGVGFWFIIVGLVVWLFGKLRFLPHREIYRWAAGALVSTGIGFFFPAPFYVDGLIIFGLLAAVDVVLHWRRKRTKQAS